MTINERIKEIRKMSKLNQDEFANAIGISRSGVQKIEYSNVSINESTKRSICREFGISREWLETGEGEMFQTDEDKEFTTMSNMIVNGTDAQKTLLRFIAGMDEKLLEALVDYAHEFFKE